MASETTIIKMIAEKKTNDTTYTASQKAHPAISKRTFVYSRRPLWIATQTGIEEEERGQDQMVKPDEAALALMR